MAAYVYMTANRKNGAIYTGVTSAIQQRVSQHKEKTYKGFSARHGVDRLVWYEVHDTVENAIAREKQIKKWNRQWKIELFVKANPDWKDLFGVICG